MKYMHIHNSQLHTHIHAHTQTHTHLRLNIIIGEYLKSVYAKNEIELRWKERWNWVRHFAGVDKKVLSEKFLT